MLNVFFFVLTAKILCTDGQTLQVLCYQLLVRIWVNRTHVDGKTVCSTAMGENNLMVQIQIPYPRCKIPEISESHFGDNAWPDWSYSLSLFIPLNMDFICFCTEKNMMQLFISPFPSLLRVLYRASTWRFPLTKSQKFSLWNTLGPKGFEQHVVELNLVKGNRGMS